MIRQLANGGLSAVVPDRRIRLAAALALGLAAGLYCAACIAITSHDTPSDFEFWWRATRLWSAGVNPYAMRPGMVGWPLGDPVLYPLPALVLTWPLQTLRLGVAAGLFMGISSACLAWAVTRDGLWRLWIFASPAFILAMKFGQWSPLLTFGALVPAAGFVLAAKPTLGLAYFVYRPNWRAVIGGIVLVALSFLLWPGWLGGWLANLRTVPGHGPPVTTALGAVPLLAVLRWRRPEARLLLAMVCVPQLLFFYDQLILGLVARTQRQALLLSACGFAAWNIWAIVWLHTPFYVAHAGPYAMIGCYYPALLLVLLRPNEGTVPEWLDSLSARVVRQVRLPARMRRA